jgi:outer membrane protein OmpA-like peptidoglycan-associated protein
MRTQQAPEQTAPQVSTSGPTVSGPGASLDQDTSNALACEQMCDGEAVTDPALQAFLQTGAFGPSTLQAPTGIGGFDAEYYPSGGDLVVSINGNINFLDGLTDNGGVFVANNSDLNQAAIDGNNIADPTQRAAFLALFQWDASVQDDWIAQLESNVMGTWSNQFSFGVDRPGWDCVIAMVRVEVDIVANQCRAADHVAIEAFKCPDDGSYDVGAFVDGDGTAQGNIMVLSSRDGRTSDERTASGESLLQRQIGPFALNSANTAPLSGDINAFAADFIDANGDMTNPVSAAGRASSEGSVAYNERLGLQRANAVKSSLEGQGFSNVRTSVSSEGEAGADTDESWRRVDLTVGDGRAQDVGAHEFGHLLGLTDHYDNAGTDANGDGVADRGGTIDGTGQPAGTLAGHDNLARTIGVAGGAVHENNDGIMSLGANVEASNYATIGWALQTLTAIPEWRINA